MLTVAGDVRVAGENAEFFHRDTMPSGVHSYVAGLLFTALAILVLVLVLALAAAIELDAARRLAVAVALDEERQGAGPDFR